jgi:hypothetical protein
MSWPDPGQLERLVAHFRAATLPKPEWTHAAHLAVGTWHVHHLGAPRALAELRAGIRRLNDFHATPNTDSSGYHETITRAYGILLEGWLNGSPAGSLAENVQAILASPLSARDVLLAFYSRDLLFSVSARRTWVEPDIRALTWPLPEASPASSGGSPGSGITRPAAGRGAGGATRTRRARPRT